MTFEEPFCQPKPHYADKKGEAGGGVALGSRSPIENQEPGTPTSTHPPTSLPAGHKEAWGEQGGFPPLSVSIAPSPSRALTGRADWGAPAALDPLLGAPWPAGRVSQAGSRSPGSEAAPMAQIRGAGSQSALQAAGARSLSTGRRQAQGRGLRARQAPLGRDLRSRRPGLWDEGGVCRPGPASAAGGGA